MDKKQRQTFATVWDALEDSPAEAANMRLRSELMIVVRVHKQTCQSPIRPGASGFGFRARAAGATRNDGRWSPRLRVFARLGSGESRASSRVSLQRYGKSCSVNGR
jgi:hypothetical protein